MTARVESFNKVDGSFLFAQAQLESIEKTLNQSTISPAELKSATDQLDSLREKALDSVSKEAYQSLCGRVAALSIDTWVDSIVEESFSLREGKYSSPEDLAQRVNALKKEMAKLWHNNALSIENRRFIKVATINLQCLFPSSKTDDVIYRHQIDFEKELKMLPHTQVMPTTVSESWDDAEIAFDLCEMAHAFYQNKFNEGLKRLNQLSPSQRERLEDHCLATGAEIVTKNMDLMNRIRFIQALIGYANELAQGEGIDYYPSLSEVKMMFEEVSNYS